VTVLEPNGALTARDIFSLMSRASDWRPTDDPRTPMAFAMAPGWVFKSDLSRRHLDRERVAREVRRHMALTAQVRIWHPAKTWFLVRIRRRYLACSVTPWLRVSRAPDVRWLLVLPQRRRLAARAAACGLRLDHQRGNFGFEPWSWRLYYLDDELYPLRR
jgi:hypothetical protein